jgi:MFS transporter, DHA2 family, multidrug resistance protein
MSARERRALFALLISLALATLDAAIVNTALPTIARDLAATPAASVWIINAYQIAMVATLLPLASLGEIHGHRRIYLIGLTVFTAASLACASAPTLPILAASRVVQGIGASGVMSVSPALLRMIYPPDRLGRGLGLYALVVGIGFAVGPTIASLILSVAPWPYLFSVNVPLGVFALAVAASSLPSSPQASHGFDRIAGLLSMLTMAGVILALTCGAQGTSRQIWLTALAAALGFGTLLVRHERGRHAPILPTDLLALPAFALSSTTAILAFAVQGLAFVALPFYLLDHLHRTLLDVGLLMSPWSLAVALAAPFAGRLSDRYPPGILGGVGLAILALGTASLALLPLTPSALDISIRMAICGAGFGLFQSPNVKALMSTAPPERSGGASGTVAISRLFGQASGAALAALCFSRGGTNGPLAALWLGALLSAAGSVASLLRLITGKVARAAS